jgi:RNA polymerase sigma factor (sigma-70 family)
MVGDSGNRGKRCELGSIRAPTQPCSVPDPTVQDLAEAVIAGEQGAGYLLDQRLRGPVHAFIAKRLGADAATLDELTHQAATEAILAIDAGRYDPLKARFITFVYGVVHKTVLRHRHALHRNRAIPISSLGDIEMGDEAGALPSAEDSLPPLDQIEAMRDCLQRDGTRFSLTAEERFAVIGRAHGDTYETIAARLGRSLDTVYRRSKRAIEKLRDCMKAKGHVAD